MDGRVDVRAIGQAINCKLAVGGGGGKLCVKGDDLSTSGI